ncbi:MaoC family dehydratase [Bacillus sp. HMF5848]|uniref:MaoC family dehydratase n=1 Tax=Bacillus sp. HMF5848 TaxID=2495421 RepID=UPI0021ADBB13|nr:MaoC family dehydratase [Bacillus sp. HMF5848]
MSIAIGTKASISKTIAECDIYSFAGITGDFNPAHIDEEYAKTTPFQTRVAHGMLTGGLISAVLGMKLPGPGAIYVGQQLRFKKPVMIGDTVTAEVEAIELVDKGKYQLLVLRTNCFNQRGEIVVEGMAEVIPPQN